MRLFDCAHLLGAQLAARLITDCSAPSPIVPQYYPQSRGGSSSIVARSSAACVVLPLALPPLALLCRKLCCGRSTAAHFVADRSIVALAPPSVNRYTYTLSLPRSLQQHHSLQHCRSRYCRPLYHIALHPALVGTGFVHHYLIIYSFYFTQNCGCPRPSVVSIIIIK